MSFLYSNFFLRIFTLGGMLFSLFYIFQLNQKRVKRKFILPFVLIIFWGAVTGGAQILLYGQYGQFAWAARLSESIGLISLIVLGFHISLSDEFSPIWRLLKYLDKLAE